MFFGVALLAGGRRVVGWGRKSYFGPAEISSFSSWDLCRRNKHDSLWIFLHFIFMSHYCFRSSSLGIHKYLDLPLSSIILQPTAKQITISINKFICFCCLKYYRIMVYKKNWKWSVWYISDCLQKKLFVEKKKIFCRLCKN